jgi:hypothetical protein
MLAPIFLAHVLLRLDSKPIDNTYRASNILRWSVSVVLLLLSVIIIIFAATIPKPDIWSWCLFGAMATASLLGALYMHFALRDSYISVKIEGIEIFYSGRNRFIPWENVTSIKEERNGIILRYRDSGKTRRFIIPVVYVGYNQMAHQMELMFHSAEQDAAANP